MRDSVKPLYNVYVVDVENADNEKIQLNEFVMKRNVVQDNNGSGTVLLENKLKEQWGIILTDEFGPYVITETNGKNGPKIII